MTSGETSERRRGERRRHARYQPDQAVAVSLTTDGRRMSAVIEDISVRGMKLVPSGDCPVGSQVALSHPAAGCFRGVAVWRDAQSVGIELTEPCREIERVLQCLSLLIGLRKED